MTYMVYMGMHIFKNHFKFKLLSYIVSNILSLTKTNIKKKKSTRIN